ncbi:MAG TPA: carboxypeptidase regulatory-like domain-containing protein, partial [Candidatus Angelobacter sp.]
MKYRNQIAAFMLCLLLASPALATQITGTVTNGTTNKPSAGDEVVLLSLAGGMDEVSRTKTDNQGRYSLTLPDNQTQHLIRVTRQSVSYFKSVLPGAATADVTVF